MQLHRKSLGLTELIAIAIGGMVGGGIFTILGISVAMVGALAPFAIALGGAVALMAAYAYVKLGVYYRDEGATYAFFKRTYPDSHLAASFIGWYTVFGYISTLALYAYTFASYGISGSEYAQSEWMRKLLAITILWMFAGINLWSVKGMGRLEDWMVYIKLSILSLISVLLIAFGSTDWHTYIQTLHHDLSQTPVLSILIVSSVTFVAYEGFQLVINAVNEMDHPERNIPRAIYTAVILVALIYFIVALGSVLAIPTENMIQDKEYALASGAEAIMGHWGRNLVIVGAVLATSSAISGTLFGSSRQMARIADDGYLPSCLRHRHGTIPTSAIVAMSATASTLILAGGLQLILEFGSITFLLVSLLMAIANFYIRYQTGSSTLLALITILGLLTGSVLIVYYEAVHAPEQLYFILSLYVLLSLGAWGYASWRKNTTRPSKEKRS
jgi:amino acid transporter